jgi:hypothetical protein
VSSPDPAVEHRWRSSVAGATGRGRPLRILLPVAALAIALGAVTPLLLEIVGAMGRNIPRPDVQGDYVLGLLWAIALAGALWLLPVAPDDRRALLVLWMAKCFIALGFMLVYERAYPLLDSYYYIQEAGAPVSNLPMGVGQGTNNIIGIVWAHSHLTASYHAIKISFAMVGLLGIYLFYRGTVHARGREDVRLLYALGLFPSVLFWSSILGKDPVQLLGLGAYAYGVMAWSTTRRWGYLVPVALGVLLASMMRVWAAPILLFPLVVFAVGGIREVWRKVVFVGLVSVFTVLAVNSFADTLGLETVRDVYETTESISQGFAEGGSAQIATVQFTGLRSMLTFAPIGAFTALFRPLPGEIRNMFGMLAGLENALLLGLAVAALVRTRLASLRQPLVLWALVLVALWAGVYGFVSYHNLGGAARFKLQILPVLLVLLAHLARGSLPPLVGAGGPTPNTKADPARGVG